MRTEITFLCILVDFLTKNVCMWEDDNHLVFCWLRWGLGVGVKYTWTGWQSITIKMLCCIIQGNLRVSEKWKNSLQQVGYGVWVWLHGGSGPAAAKQRVFVPVCPGHWASDGASRSLNLSLWWVPLWSQLEVRPVGRDGLPLHPDCKWEETFHPQYSGIKFENKHIFFYKLNTN